MSETNPILNNPYEEPDLHYATNLAGELDYSRPVKGRRIFTPEIQTIPVRQGAQGDLMELNEVAAADHGGSNFVVRQVFFCSGDQDEFDEWKRGLSDIAKAATKKKAEQTLKVEIDDDDFTRIYGHTSHPFPVKKGQKVAVRVINQFGEETTKVLEIK